MSKRVLIVDDSTYIRKKLTDILSKTGYIVMDAVGTGEQAIDRALELQPDFITLDNILPDMTGIDVLKVLRKEGMTALVVMISAVGQQSSIEDAMQNGASDYIVKPFSQDRLLETIEKMVGE